MVFCSELMQQEFARLYGPPPLQQVLVHPFPADPLRRGRGAAPPARARWWEIILGQLSAIWEACKSERDTIA